MENMNIYCEITKVDLAKRLVYGYASTESLDSQGERVSRAAIEEAFPEYMRFANVREMHQPKAVGIVKEGMIDDLGLFVCAKIVDRDAWEKVEERVYKGFSIGGKRMAKVDDTVTKLRLTEISLVDRPANPECTFSLFKAAELGDDDEGGEDPVKKLYDGAENIDVEKKEFSDKQREKLAAKGHALPDGSFPIENESDLKNAVKAFGRAKDKAAAKAHITSRAKDLGATDLLPADWPGSTKEEKATMFKDLTKSLGKYSGEEVWDVAMATNALNDIYMLFMKEVQEDGPEAPAQIAALKAVVEGLKAFIASEIQEVTVDTLTMAERLGDMVKNMAKAGARHSKADTESIQKIHDHSTTLGATCPDCSTKADADVDIRKIVTEVVAEELAKVTKPEPEGDVKPDEAMQKMESDLAARDDAIQKLESDLAARDDAIQKLEGEKEGLAKANTDLTAKVEELEKAPAPPKGVAKVVAKGDDLSQPAAPEAPKTALEAIAKSHRRPMILHPTAVPPSVDITM